MEEKIQQLLSRHDVLLDETYMAAIRSGPDVLQTPSRKADNAFDMDVRTAPGAVARPHTVANHNNPVRMTAAAAAEQPNDPMKGRNSMLMQRPPSGARRPPRRVLGHSASRNNLISQGGARKNLLAPLDAASSGSGGSNSGVGDGSGTPAVTLKMQQRNTYGWRPAMLRPLRLGVPSDVAASLPRKVAHGADEFDMGMRDLTTRAYRVEGLVRKEPESAYRHDDFRVAVQELSWHRLVVKEEVDGYERIHGKRRPAAPKKQWKLEESIWAPRKLWCDSRDFYDTDACARRMLDKDWERGLDVSLRVYIERYSDGELSDGSGTANGGGAEDVAEVYEVLWIHRALVYMLFDYYASLGSSEDIFGMTLNDFTQFTRDFRLVDKRSKHCKVRDLDQLFVAVDASNVLGTIPEKFNRRKVLNRREWLQILVQVATNRYVKSGEVGYVSCGLHALLVSDICPRINTHLFSHPNEARSSMWYTEEMDDVLRTHEDALRLIYARACALNGPSMEHNGMTNRLISFTNWKSFLSIFNLVRADLSERDASLCFSFARMYVEDEQQPSSRVRWTHLAFEDFLEALCRMAVLKALPTDAEIAQATMSDPPVTDAGTYLLRLAGEDPATYESLLKKRKQPWGRSADHLVQPPHRCVAHLISMLIVHCQGGLQRNASCGMGLSEAQVVNYMPVLSS